MEKTISAKAIAEMIQVLKSLSSIPYPTARMEVNGELAQQLQYDRTKARKILETIN